MAADTAHTPPLEANGCNGLDPVPLHAFIRIQRARPGSEAYRLMVLAVDHLACVRDARAPLIIAAATPYRLTGLRAGSTGAHP